MIAMSEYRNVPEQNIAHHNYSIFLLLLYLLHLVQLLPLSELTRTDYLLLGKDQIPLTITQFSDSTFFQQ